MDFIDLMEDIPNMSHCVLCVLTVLDAGLRSKQVIISLCPSERSSLLSGGSRHIDRSSLHYMNVCRYVLFTIHCSSQ